ncbi:hypothetical protein NV63_13310 [Elizabethkingia anophelis]|nr:hypothetical protein NV63_13310 [Elizabethkingia anophelis]
MTTSIGVAQTEVGKASPTFKDFFCEYAEVATVTAKIRDTRPLQKKFFILLLRLLIIIMTSSSVCSSKFKATIAQEGLF